MLAQFDASAPIFRGLTQNEDISVSIASDVVYTGEPLYVADGLLAQNGPGSSRHIIDVAPGTLGWEGQISNTSPGIGVLSGAELLSTGNGQATVLVQSPGGIRTIHLQCEVLVGVAGYVKGYKPGSLAAHTYDLINSYIAGKAMTDATTKVYVSHATGELNPNRIAPEIDMSWQELRFGDGATHGPCALIGPRHALAASHYNVTGGITDIWETYAPANYPTVNSTFRRRDGSLQTTRVKAFKPLGADLTLIYFEDDVTGCDFGKLVPQSILRAKCPNLYYRDFGYPPPLRYYLCPALKTGLVGRPDLGLSGGRRLNVHGVVNSATLAGENRLSIIVGNFELLPGNLSEWSSGVVPGDSGNELFLPVIEPGQTKPTCVLLTSWHGGGGGSGPDWGSFIPEINIAMNELANVPQGTYAVQIADLSAFTDFT